MLIGEKKLIGNKFTYFSAKEALLCKTDPSDKISCVTLRIIFHESKPNAINGFKTSARNANYKKKCMSFSIDGASCVDFKNSFRKSILTWTFCGYKSATTDKSKICSPIATPTRCFDCNFKKFNYFFIYIVRETVNKKVVWGNLLLL